MRSSTVNGRKKRGSTVALYVLVSLASCAIAVGYYVLLSSNRRSLAAASIDAVGCVVLSLVIAARTRTSKLTKAEKSHGNKKLLFAARFLIWFPALALGIVGPMLIIRVLPKGHYPLSGFAVIAILLGAIGGGFGSLLSVVLRRVASARKRSRGKTHKN